jgi:hypothetical protein
MRLICCGWQVRGGALPGSPYIYRFLSIVCAWPLYHLLPYFRLTNIPASVTPVYARATEAFALLADIAAISAGVVTAQRASALQKPVFVRLISGFLVYGACWFTQIIGIDAVAILGVSLAVLLLNRPFYFAAAMIPLIFVNEKIGIILFLFLTIRCMSSRADRQAWWRSWAGSVIALLVYVIVIKIVHATGNSYQLTPSHYMANAVASFRNNLSARGLVLSWLPVMFITGLSVVGDVDADDKIFSKRDILLVPALIIIALVLTEDFDIGRIVVMSVPFFAIPAAQKIQAWAIYTR